MISEKYVCKYVKRLCECSSYKSNIVVVMLAGRNILLGWLIPSASRVLTKGMNEHDTNELPRVTVTELLLNAKDWRTHS